MESPPAALTFAQRHPILKQAFDDAIQLSWQQIGVPALGALANLIVTLISEHNAGRLNSIADVKVFLSSLVYSLIIGVVLYVLVAVVRAPFVVIGRQNQDLVHLEQRVAGAERSLAWPNIPAFPQSEVVPGPIIKPVVVAPNIQPLEPQTLSAYRQDDGVLTEGKIIERFNPWPSDNKNLGVLVLPFENRLPEGKQIGIASRVIGRIVFRSYDTRELKELSRVAWLSEPYHYVHFGQGDMHKLIVLAFEGTISDPQVSAVRRDSAGGRKGIETHRLGLTKEGLYSLTISLLNEITSEVLKKVDFILDVQLQPDFSVRLARAYSWKNEHLLEFMIEGHKVWQQFNNLQTEIHEKGEALGNYFDESLMAERGEKEKPIAETVTIWSDEVAAFIGRIFGDDEKKKFVEAVPSVQAGLERGKKPVFARIRPQGDTSYVSPIWDLGDSIRVRMDRLSTIQNSLKF